MRTHHALALAALLALPLAACGDDGDTDATASEVTTTTTATADHTVPAVPLDDACTLVADAAEVSGLPLSEAFTDGDERRRVCVFTALEPGQVGMTVGVQAGSRFDDKAEQSEAAVGPAEPIDGLGDEALFFYDDTDFPDGLGGVLVAVGDLTIDITVQGVDGVVVDEATARDAMVAIAEAAVGRL